MTWITKGCPLLAAQRLAEALRLNAPGAGTGTLEVFAVIARQPSTAREIAQATGSATGPVSKRLRWLRPHIDDAGRFVDRAPLVTARREPGARSWRYELAPGGREILRQAGYEQK